MIVEKALLEVFNDDIPNKVMAMLVSAMYGDVVWKVKTEDQLSETIKLFESMGNAFAYYYYDYEDNEDKQSDEIYDGEDIEELVAENTVSSLVNSKENNKEIYCGSNSWTLCAKKEDDGYKLTLSIDDTDKLIQALTSYYTRYEVDDLVNDYENMLLKEAHEKNLLGVLTADKYNLSYFHVNDIKYIKPICYGIIKETIMLHKANIKLNEDSEVIDFKCIIDCFDFVEDTKKQKPQIKQSKSKRRTHFAPSVQDLYDYIKRYAPAKNYEIYKEDLIGEDRRNKLYCGMGELTTAVNRLNQQYKEISGSDKPLMKYDKFLNCYIITNIWED